MAAVLTLVRVESVGLDMVLDSSDIVFARVCVCVFGRGWGWGGTYRY